MNNSDSAALGPGSEPQQPSLPALRAWLPVALLSGLYIVSWLDRLVLSLLVQPIERDLGVSDNQMGLLLGLGFVALYLVASLPLATVIDRGNRKWTLVGGAVLWCLSTVAAAYSQSFEALVVTRAGVAIGEAVLTPAAISLIADLFPRDRRSLPTSVFMAVGALSGTGAFLLGGALLAIAGGLEAELGMAAWRLTLLMVGLLGFLPLALFALLVREPPRWGAVAAHASARATLGHLRANAPLYLGISLGAGLLLMVAQGFAAWLPTLLVRGFDVAPARAGGLLALAATPASAIGSLLLPALAARRTDHALVRRVLLLVMASACLPIPFVASAGLGSLGLLLLAVGVAMLGQGSTIVLCSLLIQSTAPALMRGRVMAAFLILMNFISSGLAPIAVSATAERLFSGPQALAGGLAVTAAIGMAGALALFAWAYRWTATAGPGFKQARAALVRGAAGPSVRAP